MDATTIIGLSAIGGFIFFVLSVVLSVYVVRWGMEPTNRLIDARLQAVEHSVAGLTTQLRESEQTMAAAALAYLEGPSRPRDAAGPPVVVEIPDGTPQVVSTDPRPPGGATRMKRPSKS